MNEKELWAYARAKQIYCAHPFDRDFVWMRRDDFERVKSNFVGEYNIFHTGNSFRSCGLLLHIHAVVHGDYVSFHRDCGNIARFFPLGLIHLFVDILPYQFIEKVLRRPVRELYGYPPDAPL